MQNAPRKSGLILVDKTICHGCGICELACSLSHSGACGPAFSRIHVLRDPLAGEFVPETCKQCQFPSCYFSCPVGAIAIEPKTGARFIEAEKCKGCGLCARTCLFNENGNMIKLDSTTGKYFKCDLCSSLGQEPICVRACPWGVLNYLSITKR